MNTLENSTARIALKFCGWLTLFTFALQACHSLEDETGLRISTDHISYITEGSYEISCRVLSLGMEEITEHGVCWGESAYPVWDKTSVCLGSRSATGEFNCTITELRPDTRYYFRSFALVSSRPFYGDEIVFTTYPGDVLVDINGNIYTTVEIGDQTWMAQNLKVTRYADGAQIPFIDKLESWFHITREDKAYSWYDDRVSNGFTYGALYTWAATVRGLEVSDLNPSGIQGVCPDGWHVPSDNEWKQLEMYLGMDISEANDEGWRGEDEGGALKQKSTGYWKCPNTGATNTTGFNALPGGYRHG